MKRERKAGGDVSWWHRDYNGSYAEGYLDHVAFPLGGMGAGMICLEGTGVLSHFSLRHRPDFQRGLCVFSALHMSIGDEPGMARILEGPVP